MEKENQKESQDKKSQEKAKAFNKMALLAKAMMEADKEDKEEKKK